MLLAPVNDNNGAKKNYAAVGKLGRLKEKRKSIQFKLDKISTVLSNSFHDYQQDLGTK